MAETPSSSSGASDQALEHARAAGLTRIDERNPHPKLLARRGAGAWF